MRPSPNLIAAVVLAVLAASFLLWQRPWQGDPASDRARHHDAVGVDAPQAIAAQFRALESARTKAQFVKAAGGSAAANAWASRTFANLQALGASEVAMRFVRGGLAGVRSDDATEATIEVSWLPGAASGLSRVRTRDVDVTFVLDPIGANTFAVRSARRDDGALPIWLAGRVEVTGGSAATVIALDGGAGDRVVAEAAAARTAVRTVVKSATGHLVVIAPNTQDQAAALLDQSAGSIAQIAAVTTTIDARIASRASTIVVLNPKVFATMDARAAQVVMSHEATHALTGATGSGIETWVAEGFADYVALHADTAPLSVSAGQILRSVKADGAPEHLPTTSDFGSQQHGLGATYESAWLAFRMLGADYGDADVVAFYAAVRSGRTVDSAARSAFGIGTKELTVRWRAYLAAKSASITS